MFNDPRTKGFVDVCPRRWEMNAERETGGEAVSAHSEICSEVGPAPSHFWVVSAL